MAIKCIIKPGGGLKAVVTSTGGGRLQAKTVTPTDVAQEITPDDGYYGLSRVTIEAAPTPVTMSLMVSPSLDQQTFTPPTGVAGYNNVTVEAAAIDTAVIITPSEAVQEVTPTTGALGIAGVTVEAIPSKYHDTSDATAGAAQIMKGYTAYNGGGKVTGTMTAAARGDILTLTKSYTLTDDDFSQKNKTLVSVNPNITALSTSKINTIGAKCFEYNWNIEVIDCPEVTGVGDSAFSQAAYIQKINLPKLISISSNAFANAGQTADASTFNLTDNTFRKVTKIGSAAFNHFGPSGNTQNLYFDSVTQIDLWAFEYVNAKAIYLGSKLTKIGSYVFISANIEALVLSATTPPTLQGKLDFSTPTFIIYVPTESVEAYKVATNWSTYADLIKPISDYNGGS